MSSTIQIKCVMDSEFCKGNTWYQIRSMSDHVVYVYLDKYEFVGLPKCHFDMDNIRELKENKMQEKVTLKVGDMLEGESLLGGKKLIITSFGYDRINVACGNFWNYPLLSEKYYVNGKLYARENIIVPDFKEKTMQRVIHDSDCSLHNEPAYPNGDCDCSVSIQEITKDNIVEVLEYNNLYAKIEADLLYIYFFEDDYYSGNADIVINIQMDNLVKIIEATYNLVDLKLKPLPKANPFDVVGVGQWVRSLTDCNIWRTKSKWYQRYPDIALFRYKNNEGCISWSEEPTEWDLTDIRDYNPTECALKIGDKIITKSGYGHEVSSFSYYGEYVYFEPTAFRIDLKDIKSVNGRKYDKITIPKFDFAQCLVDAGFTRIHGHIGNIPNCTLLINGLIKIEIINNKYFWMEESLEPTPANAKIIIETANLAKGIK